MEYAQSVSLSVTKETLKSRILDQKQAVYAFTKLSIKNTSQFDSSESETQFEIEWINPV